jgi:hypothetical protein
MTSGISPDEALARGEQKKIQASLKEGYELYRAIAWNSSCDFIALNGEEVLRIQLRGRTDLDEFGQCLRHTR